jgi:hypothetical protein
MIADAVDRIRRMGFEPPSALTECLDRLYGLVSFFHRDHLTSGSEYHRHLAYRIDADIVERAWRSAGRTEARLL